MADLRTVPVNNELGNYTFSIDFEGETYTLGLRYNRRAEYWVLDIMDSDGVDILIGLPLLLGADLTRQFVKKELPKGGFFVVNYESPFVEPTETTLGTSCELIYRESV